MMVMKVKLSDGARAPERKSFGASGHDVESNERITLEVGERKAIRTGLSFEVPIGFEIQIRPRSGLAIRGVDVILGTVDSDYRGEVYVILVNNTGAPLHISKQMRIAQAVIAKVYTQEMVVTNKLSETKRGANGLGSTGV